jgi:hypothetical protein
VSESNPDFLTEQYHTPERNTVIEYTPLPIPRASSGLSLNFNHNADNTLLTSIFDTTVKSNLPVETSFKAEHTTALPDLPVSDSMANQGILTQNDLQNSTPQNNKQKRVRNTNGKKRTVCQRDDTAPNIAQQRKRAAWNKSQTKRRQKLLRFEAENKQLHAENIRFEAENKQLKNNYKEQLQQKDLLLQQKDLLLQQKDLFIAALLKEIEKLKDKDLYNPAPGNSFSLESCESQKNTHTL